MKLKSSIRGANHFFLEKGKMLLDSFSDSPQTHSPHCHALQELKDALLDNTAWPVMKWFNEDH